MKFWITLFVLALLAMPQAMAGEVGGDDPRSSVDVDRSAADQADRDLKNIKAWLSHFHKVPSRAELEQVSDDARDIVFKLAADEESFLFHRQRAIRALAHWADDEVRALFNEMLADEAIEEGLLFHIIPALANGFGEDAIDDLVPYLRDHDNPHIRISAARAIASIPGEEGQPVLAEALHDEEHPIVKKQLEDLSMILR